MAKKSIFHIGINKGPTQTIKTRSGLYVLAAGAALAQLEYTPTEDGADVVKIWVPELLPDYGPYFYAFHEGRIFHLVESLNKELIW